MADGKEIIELTNHEQTISETEERLNEILQQAFQAKPESAVRDLETVKLILLMLQDKTNVGSLTNLSDLHIEAISDAEALNCLFDNELIEMKINSFRIHRRSLTKEPQSLLHILGSAVGIQMGVPENKGFLGSLRNKLG